MNYIVTKPLKSKGIASLLVFLFGGIGLFYASVTGGVIMGIFAPIAIFVFFFWGLMTDQISISILILLFCCTYYIICLVWAIKAVNNHNADLIKKSNYYNSFYQKDGSHEPFSNSTNERSNLWVWVLVLLILCSFLYIAYQKGMFSTAGVQTLNNNQPTIKTNQKYNSNNNQILKQKNSDEKLKIDISQLKKNKTEGWKVTNYLENGDNTKMPMLVETENRILIFDSKKIYMILNGKIIKIWHESKNYMNDEVAVTETKEGDTFSDFAGITIDYKSGKTVFYEGESLPVEEIYIKKEFIK